MNNNSLTPRVASFALSDKGRRPNNEDYVTSFEPNDPKERQASGCIYIVADGVEGAAIGERASKYAAEKVLYEYIQHPEIEPALRLKQAITQANREIFEYAEEKGIRMATTMTIAVVIGNSLIAANVGDSRVYLIHGNEVQQVTRDHNIVGELVRDGLLTEAEVLKSKAKNKLTRSIGGNDEVHVDVFDPIALRPDDKILLCSDGLTRYALKEDIAGMAANGSPELISKAAITFAKKRGHGGADNISVITVVYEPTKQLDGVAMVSTRPIDPEEPWEIMETDPGFKKKMQTRSQPVVWLFSGAVGIALVALLTITGFYLMSARNTTKPPEVSQIAVVGQQATWTAALIETQDITTLIVENPTSDNTDLRAPFMVTPMGVVKSDCPKFIRVRANPSRNDDTSPEIGKLNCGQSIVLLGKYVDESENTWLLIDYQDPSGNRPSAWVIGNSVDVSPNVLEQLPNVVPPEIPTATLLPVISTATAIPATTIAVEQNSNCKYKVRAQDTLTGIANKFGLGGNYYGIRCAPDSPGACDLSNPNQITTGWVLIIPNITADVCAQNGGLSQ